MQTRILLINFTKKETEKIIKKLPFKFDRGYLGDIIKLSTVSSIYLGEDEDTINNFNFFVPHPVYEYKITFINLNKNSEIETEFKEKSQRFSIEDRKNFTKYWFYNDGFIIIFLGDYNFNELTDLGIPDLQLTKVNNTDLTINEHPENKRKEVCETLHKSKSKIIIPVNYYIDLDEKSVLRKPGDYKLKYIFWNNNNNDISVFIDYNAKSYNDCDKPKIIILPQFKQNIKIVEDISKMIAKLNPCSFPELPNKDWIHSDQYYPKKIKGYDDNINEIIIKTKEQISEIEKQKEDIKKKYNTVKNLLYQKGEDLKYSVIDVLSKYFELTIIDSDKDTDKTLADEDIIVIENERKILFEIKGDNKKYPSPHHIGQVWKHLCRNKTITEGGLILNYDIQTKPEERQLAYTGENENELNDIIFIDTRVLYKLTLAIIDYNLPIQEAKKILLVTGRVNFNFDEYVKNNDITKD